MNFKLIPECVRQQQFREKPNRAKAHRASLFDKQKAIAPGIQAEDGMGWVWKARLLGIWKANYEF